MRSTKRSELMVGLLMVGGANSSLVTGKMKQLMSDHTFIEIAPGSKDLCHDHLMSADGVPWDEKFCMEEEYNYILSFSVEIYECLSRPSRLEGLKKMSIQDYQDKLRSQYILLKKYFFCHAIDIVLFGNFPHEGYDIICALICAYNRIAFFVLYQLPFCSKFAVVAPSLKFACRWDFDSQISPDPPFSKTSKIFTQIDFYIDLLLSKNKKPFYMLNTRTKGLPRIFSYESLPKNFKLVSWAKDFLLKLVTVRKNHLFKVQLLKYSIPKEALPLKDYIYVPLHLQPEMATSALGGRFANDQTILISQMACEARKLGKSLIIKENPKQSFSHRSTPFFSLCASFKNLYFSHPLCSSKELLKNADAVATISGTIGVEAIAVGKPVYCSGTAWWQDHPLVYRDINAFRACLDGKNQFQSRIHQQTNKTLKNHLLDVAERAWDGVINESYLALFGIERDENYKILALSLKILLEKFSLRG